MITNSSTVDMVTSIEAEIINTVTEVGTHLYKQNRIPSGIANVRCEHSDAKLIFVIVDFDEPVPSFSETMGSRLVESRAISSCGSDAPHDICVHPLNKKKVESLDMFVSAELRRQYHLEENGWSTEGKPEDVLKYWKYLFSIVERCYSTEIVMGSGREKYEAILAFLITFIITITIGAAYRKYRSAIWMKAK